MFTSCVVAVALLLAPATAPAQAPAPTGCAALSPIALPCVALQKVAEAASAFAPDLAAYRASWEHRAAVFQSRLGDRLPLREATFVGTHNSFNAVAAGLTLSHADSNQRMTLVQQLDADVRSLELDLHLVGGRVRVCHGRGRDELHLGCTSESGLAEVLAPVAAWLRTNPDEVLLLYLEDHVEDAQAYAGVVRTLTEQLRIHRPDPARISEKGCATLPLDLTRRAIRAGGAQVVVVGDCAAGWGSVVHEWRSVHVESGSTARYRPFPACDATYPRAVYGQKIVRYFEDSTLVATVVDPTTPSVDPDALTPEKVRAMTACGVTLLGLDQLTPTDGRLAATLWSWAPGEPGRRDGCARTDADGRWVAAPCAERRRAACARDGRWTLTRRAAPYAQAAGACRASARRGTARFALPLSANANAELHRRTGGTPVWIRYRVGRSAPAAP
ncbi:hypothetical protein [Paraconexibacter algicola]|uniref:hypothetical protein n=1 Tax=Paraconexibacter algicola TaxID=2133960 RepID=UPI0018EE7F93|nr:hypothetical protein [Paraconexibacter algicola]